ncbi:MAG: hypothetical protein ACREUU_14250, partial [Gammaproteobacteria bacterium]
MDVALEPFAAFDTFVEELTGALARVGIRFEPGEEGRVTEGAVVVGRVVSWRRGERVALEWHQADWEPSETTNVELRFEPVEG